jgi:hypothetical protein
MEMRDAMEGMELELLNILKISDRLPLTSIPMLLRPKNVEEMEEPIALSEWLRDLVASRLRS